MAKVPLRHISIRVPWHDNKWNGCACSAPLQNTACTALPRIREERDDAIEKKIAGKDLRILGETELPSCVAERVSFMDPEPFTRSVIHPYKKKGSFYPYLKSTSFRLPPYSAAVVPFRWMLKENAAEIAERYEVDYDPQREPTEPEWLGNSPWVQEPTNQRNLLSAFGSGVQSNCSLCVFCVKQAPIDEAGSRIIVGMGRVISIAAPKPYATEDQRKPVPFIWDMPLQHSIRPDFEDGFLLPYHSILKRAQCESSIDLSPFVATVPEDRLDEFSYGCEHVTHDGVIGSLLACKSALQKAAPLVDEPCSRALKWIDHRLSELWKLRGPFPGLGAALHAFGLKHGNFVAYAISEQAPEDMDPWPSVEKMFKDPSAVLPPELRKEITKNLMDTWNHVSQHKQDRVALLKLLSRMELTNAQAMRMYDQDIRKKCGIAFDDQAFLRDPYLIYEADRFSNYDPEGNFPKSISLQTVERAVFPDAEIRRSVPLPPLSAMESEDDTRRIRALSVESLEKAAIDGHTLVPIDRLLDRFRSPLTEPPCKISRDTLEVIGKELAPLIAQVSMKDKTPAFKLDRLERCRDLIRKTVEKRIKKGKPISVNADWPSLLEKKFGIVTASDDDEKRARFEKASCLDVIASSRLSVLIGPAGTGKTTVLELLCNHPEIKPGGVLLLAPTGKARVQLQQKTGIQAQTLAQFLVESGRYDPVLGIYKLSGVQPENHGRTIVVDECSMLTEEQLAALLDAVGGMDRLILVGDPRQLPPIGAGRPFVDIVQRLAPENIETVFPKTAPGYAELTVRRRRGQDDTGPDTDKEDIQLASFFGGRPLAPGEDEILSRVSSHDDFSRLRFVGWKDDEDLREKIVRVIVEELHLSGPEDFVSFNIRNGGVVSNGQVYFRTGHSGQNAENWQIMCPLRGRVSGVSELNRLIQKHFRKNFLAFARQPKRPQGAAITRPQGLEEIVYGDKVINVQNRRRNKFYPKKESALRYVANGEIGIVTGQFKRKGESWSPWQLQVEFSSQQGIAYDFGSYEFSEEGSTVLELAYAVTVHKAQGSEFDLTILVIPNPCRLISRELLYTALTRQRSRIVILHQGDRSDLWKYSTDRYSVTAARLTDLFEPPAVRQIADSFLEERLINVSRRGEPMRSKSEVIIANELDVAGIHYVYEQKLVGTDGQIRYPDFTIEDQDSGITYYWEHCGMLADQGYRKRWEAKKAWYRSQLILPHEESGGERGTLVVTSDSEAGGIRSDEVKRLIEEIF